MAQRRKIALGPGSPLAIAAALTFAAFLVLRAGTATVRLEFDASKIAQQGPCHLGRPCP